MNDSSGDSYRDNASGSGWRSSSWSRLLLPLCLVVYLALGVTYALVLPLGQAPDEPAHFQYALFIAEHRRLPDIRVDEVGYEGYQAPLYYTLCAAVGKLAMIGAPDDPQPIPAALQASDEQILSRLPRYPTVREGQHELALDALKQAHAFTVAERRAWLAMRLFTVLLGGIGVFLCYRIIFLLFPQRPWIAATAVAGMATLPMYTHICASVSNDPPTVVAVGLMLLLSLLILREGPTVGRCALLGLAMGIGMLTKDSANAALPAVLLAVVWSVGRRYEPKPAETALTDLARRIGAVNWRLAAMRIAVVLGSAAIVAGWWYGRNTLLYGSPTHFPANPDKQVPWQTYLGYPEAIWQVLSIALPMLFRNFWAGFAWTNIAVAPWIYWLLLGVKVTAIPGQALLIGDVVARRLGWSVFQRRGFWILFIAKTLLTLAVVWYILLIDMGGGSQGRYLFPALPAIMLLWAIGIGRVLPESWHRAVPFVAGGALLLFSLYCLIGVIAPFYRAMGL